VDVVFYHFIMVYLRILLLLFIVFIYNKLSGQSIDDRYTINEIEILTNNVFDDDSKGYHRLMNKFHIVTKDQVIERELLFKKSDTLDIELIEESLRKLRRLHFIQTVEIEIDTMNADSVNINVITKDHWSLVPNFIIEAGGGLIGVGASVEESNFLGLGKNLYIEAYNESDIGTTWTLSYYDPQVFGSTIRSYIEYNTGPLIQEFTMKAYQPFYSSDSKFTYGLRYEYKDEKQRLFYEGEEFSRINYNKTGIYSFGGYAFGKRYRKKKIYLMYRYEDKKYSDLGEQTTTPLPDDEIVSATTIGFEIESEKFSTNTKIDNFRQIEDFTLGYSTYFSIGKAGFPVPVGVQRFEFYFSHSHGFMFAGDQYLFLDISYDNQVDRNTIYSTDNQYYNRLFNWSTLAINFEFEYASVLEESRQFILGGASGLRGYEAREFTGDKLMLLNIENRFFTDLELLTIQLGFVGFVDIGNVWNRGKDIDLSQLNYSAGFGLRLGYTKITDAPVVRIDIGWPLNRKSGFGLSFGIDQQF